MGRLTLSVLFLMTVACADAEEQPGDDAGAGSAEVVLLDAAAPDTTVGEGSGDAAVSEVSDIAPDAGPTEPALPGTPLPTSEQRPGDPVEGFQRLAHGDYVGCGIPKKLYTLGANSGFALDGPPLPGRDSTLPYYLNEFTTPKGVTVISPNCLTCHAQVMNGEVVVGLGATTLDFGGLAAQVASLESAADFVRNLVTPEELAELKKFANRLGTIAPYVQPLTLGVNPADNLAAILFAHRDRKTLAWSNEPLMEPPPEHVAAVDVPPWWHMAKKNTMFYLGAGVGDHARMMMTASTLCVDEVEVAEAIDAYFPHVRAYIETVKAPQWPWEIDAELAAKGRTVFESTCSGCHGTYGEDGVYPNLLIDVDVVQTDDLLAVGTSHFVKRFVDWFNESFYGEIAELVHYKGYVAPPLDGIWATAPYLHNGSVPTLRALLDSPTRPTYWTRSYQDGDYDKSAVGYTTTVLEAGQDAEPSKSKRKLIYDTTKLGYGNDGHPFGDSLSDADRDAVIEYLKTL